MTPNELRHTSQGLTYFLEGQLVSVSVSEDGGSSEWGWAQDTLGSTHSLVEMGIKS